MLGQRSSWWIIGLTLIVPVLATLIWAANTSPASDSRLDEIDAVVGSTTSSIFEALVLLVLFGALIASNEFDTRTITTTFAAVPRRWPVIVAKAILVFGISGIVAVVINFVGFLLSAAVTDTSSLVTIGDGGVVAALLGTALFEASAATIALCVALVIRSNLGAVAGAFGFLYVIPGAINLIPLDPVHLFVDTFPANASDGLISVVPDPSNLPSGAAVVAIIAWTLIWVGIAILVVRRRDV